MRAKIGDKVQIENYGLWHILEESNGVARIENESRTIFAKISKIKDGKLDSKDIVAITSYHVR